MVTDDGVPKVRPIPADRVLLVADGMRLQLGARTFEFIDAPGHARHHHCPIDLDLGDDEIEYYLRMEQPYDCAGSAKSEGLGIALLSAIDSDDPTALIGLPLIRTTELLRRAGIDPLRATPSPSSQR